MTIFNKSNRNFLRDQSISDTKKWHMHGLENRKKPSRFKKGTKGGEKLQDGRSRRKEKSDCLVQPCQLSIQLLAVTFPWLIKEIH